MQAQEKESFSWISFRLQVTDVLRHERRGCDGEVSCYLSTSVPLGPPFSALRCVAECRLGRGASPRKLLTFFLQRRIYIEHRPSLRRVWRDRDDVRDVGATIFMVQRRTSTSRNISALPRAIDKNEGRSHQSAEPDVSCGA